MKHRYIYTYAFYYCVFTENRKRHVQYSVDGEEKKSFTLSNNKNNASPEKR